VTAPEKARRSPLAAKGAASSWTGRRSGGSGRRGDGSPSTSVLDGPPRGLVENFRDLAGPACDPLQIDGRVAEFYEQTSEYELDAWSEWHGGFRPFGGAGTHAIHR
jgi:hypothetical protein